MWNVYAQLGRTSHGADQPVRRSLAPRFQLPFRPSRSFCGLSAMRGLVRYFGSAATRGQVAVSVTPSVTQPFGPSSPNSLSL